MGSTLSKGVQLHYLTRQYLHNIPSECDIWNFPAVLTMITTTENTKTITYYIRGLCSKSRKTRGGKCKNAQTFSLLVYSEYNWYQLQFMIV